MSIPEAKTSMHTNTRVLNDQYCLPCHPGHRGGVCRAFWVFGVHALLIRKTSSGQQPVIQPSVYFRVS